MSGYIKRDLESEIARAMGHYPVVTVTGPRQSGKTTLCRQLFSSFDYVNLEDLTVRELVGSNPKAFLEQFEKGLIVDEVQRFPEILSQIQVVVDEYPNRKFVLTGSSQLSLVEGVTQSLAGRTAMFTLLPLSLSELAASQPGRVDQEPVDSLILNGGYPAVWARGLPATDFARNYYATFVERDIRQLINIREVSKFRTFMRLCAGRIGTEFNASALSNAVGVSSVTIQDWLSVLETAYVVYRLPPFHKNVNKRLVKAQKLYFYDTALACYLLSVEETQQLATHPLRGELFENLVITEFLKRRLNQGKTPNLLFYRDQSQREIDLVVEAVDGYHGYEIKSASSYHRSFTKNLDYLAELLGEQLLSSTVIYTGETEIPATMNAVRNFFKLATDTS